MRGKKEKWVGGLGKVYRHAVPDVQGWTQESHSADGIELGEGCEEQEEFLLHIPELLSKICSSKILLGIRVE